MKQRKTPTSLKDSIKMIQKNKSAFFQYEILKKLEAGIILKGTEIKSIRQNKVNIKDAFVQISTKLEAEVFNLHISAYAHQRNVFFNHNPERIKKLLLKKKEIKKLYQEQKEKSLSIVVLAIYLKKGLAKIELGVGRGKKLFDKRQAIKQREEKRKIQKINYL